MRLFSVRFGINLKIQKMFESVPYVIELNKDYTRKEKK